MCIAWQVNSGTYAHHLLQFEHNFALENFKGGQGQCRLNIVQAQI